jgi:hypothetical protein
MICPGCRQDVAPTPVGFTWWGGVLGPKLLHHVQCPSCRVRFNGLRGTSNTRWIAAYLGIAGVLAVIIGYLVSRAR